MKTQMQPSLYTLMFLIKARGLHWNTLFPSPRVMTEFCLIKLLIYLVSVDASGFSYLTSKTCEKGNSFRYRAHLTKLWGRKQNKHCNLVLYRDMRTAYRFDPLVVIEVVDSRAERTSSVLEGRSWPAILPSHLSCFAAKGSGLRFFTVPSA